MKAIFLVLFFNILFFLPGRSMPIDSIPVVGDPLPFFELKSVSHYPKGQVTLDDFKGKWLILDFWFTGCTVCIKSFPKVNRLQKLFKDRIQFVMVGLNEHRFNADIEELYEGLRERMNLELVSAYDSVLFDDWNIQSMPFIIVVNPEGVVYAITDGRDMDEGKLTALLDGQKVTFYSNNPPDRSDSVKIKPSVLFQSSITRWNPGDLPDMFKYFDPHSDAGNPVTCKINRVSLKKMYLFAYTGKLAISPLEDVFQVFYPTPILEVSDTAIFASDFNTGKNIFNYKLKSERGAIDSVRLLGMLREDIKRTFGFNVAIEEREVPVWKLVSKEGALEKLRTNADEFYFSGSNSSGGAAGFDAKDIPMENLLHIIMRYIYDNKTPYFDETGISENVDISIDALMTDRHEIISELNKWGLDLVLGTRRMKVIVIKD